MRILLLCIVLSLKVHTFDVNTASKIFNKIFTALYPNQMVKIYTANPEYLPVIRKAPKLMLVNNVHHTHASLVTSPKELYGTQHKLIFTTSLNVLRKSPKAIGAFYWEYGRPKIVFIQPRLNHYHLTLPKSFHKYIVKDVP